MLPTACLLRVVVEPHVRCPLDTAEYWAATVNGDIVKRTVRSLAVEQDCIPLLWVNGCLCVAVYR